MTRRFLYSLKDNMMKKLRSILLYAPIVNGAIFFVLFLISASLYPGGHNWDPSTEGFHWLFNFFCDLFHHTAHNDEPNIGRPYILAAGIFILFSFLFFWISMVNFWFFTRKQKPIINIYGLLIVFDFSLLMWFHDSVLYIGMGMAVFGFIYLLHSFYRQSENAAFWITLILMVLISLNFITWSQNIFYQSSPIFQKAAFLFYLVWIFFVSYKVILFNRQKSHAL